MSLRNLINALIRNRKTLIALSAVVVFVTTYLLILPAAALEKGAAEEMGGIDVDQKAVEETTGVSADDSGDGSIDDSDAKPSADVTEEDAGSDSEQPELTFEGEGFTVDVADPQGVLPEDTELSVSEITTDDKKYDQYCSDALAALVDNTGAGSGSEPGFVRLYDIKLIAGDQVIEPENSVKVTISYDNKHKSNSGENALKTENEESVYVVHFKEDEATGEEQAEVLDKEATSFQIHREQLEEATFEADSFSVYAIVDLPGETVSTLDDIGQEGYQISIKTGNGEPSSSANYYMTGNLVDNVSGDSDRKGIDAIQYNTNTIPQEAIQYYFDRIGNSNQFYIYMMDGLEKKYIQMTPVSGNVKRAGLTFAEDENEKTAFSLIKETQGRFQVSASIKTTSGAQKTYYWVRNTNNAGGVGAIVGYDNKSDANTAWIGLHPERTSDPYDGKSYSLLIWDGGKTAKALTGDENDGHLCADFLTVMTKTGDAEDKLYVPENTADTLSSWKFELINDGLYKLSTEVSTEDGVKTKYLKIDASGLSMVDSDAASEIQVIPGTGIHKGQIILKSGDNVLTYSGVYKEGFDTNAGAGKEYLYLAEARGESELKDYYRTYSATKISVSDPSLSPESPDAEPKKIIIYTRVWNGSGYTYFAVNGEGELVPCYERGDSIEWIGSTLDELQWEFTEYGDWSDDGTFTPNTYYELKNVYTQKYLAPQREGKDGERAQKLSDNTIGLKMMGRGDGQYYTPIKAWDTDNYSYTSINVDLDAGADAVIEACISRYGLDFYFATVDEIPADDTLHTVSTVDNDQFGIKMKLVNFGSRPQMSNFLGDDTGGMTTKLVQGLLSTNLIGEGEEKYPTAKGVSLGTLFNNNNPQVVNHLFTDSTFRATGYYEYDSAQNFAHLITEDNDPWIGQPSPNGGTYKKGDFVVYQELGSYDSGGDKYTLKHGQFFPFNDLEPGVFASTNGRNLYTPTGKKLDESDPRFNEQLYMIKNTDCYFGTELTATFEQTPSGLDAWGHDIIFEFSGDDDFWLYVDNELIIDLGGIHSAVPGTVNFRTGKVNVNNGEPTTLLDLFAENKAGRGEYGGDKEAAKAALLNEETGIFVMKPNPDDPDDPYYVFKDNTAHTMRIFYMERGAGASNLHMRFNLAAVKKGTVQLSKKLSNADDAGANATAYPYQIFFKNPVNSSYVQLTDEYLGGTLGGSVKYKGSVNDVEYRKDYHIDHDNNNVTYRAKYNDVFLLPAGETAEITFPTFGPTGEEKYVTEYYIVECGVDPEIYPNVTADGVTITEENKTTDIIINENGEEEKLSEFKDTGLRDYSIEYSTLDERPRVTYDNEVKETKSINIIKELYKKENDTREKIDLYDANGDPIDTYNPDLDRVFEFRLKLRAPNSDTEWKDCNRIIYYHVKDPKGHYCIWDKDEGKLVATDRSTLEDLTEEEKIPYTFESSESGAMSNIPAYYTVEVNGLIPGTEYQVVERPGETPAGYQFYKYKAGTRETEEGYDPLTGIEGSITTDDDDNTVFVCNDKGYELILKKEWADAATIENRAPTYFAVFYEVKDPDTGKVTARKLIADSVKQLKYNAKPQKLDWWYLNLPEIDGVNDPVFGQFVVYEVTGTFDDEGAVTNSQKVNPVLDGGGLILNGTPLGGSETAIAYKVTYADPKMTGDNVMEFEATNTRSEDPSVKFLKEDWSGRPLQNAEFTLKLGSDTVFNKTSDGDGLISTEFLSQDTDYVLEETKAPQGYYGLQEPLTVKLIKDGDEWTLNVRPNTGDIASYYEVDPEKNCVTLTVKNRPYAFEAVKVDSTDDSTKIKGAKFELQKPVTVQGQTAWEPMVWDGESEFVTGEDGSIPHVDSNLPAGTYRLHEVNAADGYNIINKYVYFTVSRQGSITLGEAPGNVELSGPDEGTGAHEGKLVYTLKVPNDPMPLKLKKVDKSTDDTLKGAVFRLTKKTDGATGGDGHQIWDTLPGSNGIIDMTDKEEVKLPLLPPGYYMLEETDAPAGYVILDDKIYFHIKADRTVELCDEDGKPFAASQIPEYETLSGNKSTGFTIIAKDSAGTELPMTGGIGTTIFYVLGTMLVLGCGVYLIARRRISQ